MGEVTLSPLVVGPFQTLLPAQTALGRERLLLARYPCIYVWWAYSKHCSKRRRLALAVLHVPYSPDSGYCIYVWWAHSKHCSQRRTRSGGNMPLIHLLLGPFHKNVTLMQLLLSPFQTLLPAQNALGREHSDLGRRLGFEVWRLGFRVWGLGFMVWRLAYRVEGLRVGLRV